MSKRNFRIQQHEVGEENPCFVVAEIGQAHDGSLGMAHAYIDAVARAGAHAIKFQTHIASEESTTHERFRVPMKTQDSSRYEYWKRMEFSEDQWGALAGHAKARNLVFLSSPFSIKAAQLLERLGVPAWKIASGEVDNHPFLEWIAATGKPSIISSGLSNWASMDTALDILGKNGSSFATLQCTTSYPCPPEAVGLNVIAEMKEKYGCPTGLSDHSGQIAIGLASVAMGSDILEVHVTLSKESFGPDVPASLTTQQLAELVQGAEVIERALGNPVNKSSVSSEAKELMRLFGKSVVLSHSLDKGHKITAGDLKLKKPGTGIPAKRFKELIGMKLTRKLPADTILAEYDLER